MIPSRPAAIVRVGLAAAAALALAGCSTLSSWTQGWSMPSIPTPWSYFTGSSKKPGPLPELTPSATATVAWQAPIGKAEPGLEPAVTADGVFVAASDGAIARLDAATGRTVWRISAPKRISAGPGVGSGTVVVATDKGDVYAFDLDGKPRWTTQVTSDVTAPPLVSDGIVIVSSGDGRVYGLNAEDGKTKWVYSRANPPLTVRNRAPGVAARGGAFVAMPGGRLVALDIASGNVGWDGTVAVPRGATELERVDDVTSRPVLEDRQVCAAAYQGRVVCFDVVRGTVLWSRDLSSLGGIVTDDKSLYVTDDAGNVHALDKTTGASIWKQDKLAARRIGGPQLFGDLVGVVDVEGYVHLLNRSTGAYVGRLATDGSAPTGQPLGLLGNAVWQSRAGTVFAVGAR